MKRFAIKLLLFLGFSLLLSTLLLLFYAASHDLEHDLPSPNLSNSLSLNEKLLFLRNHSGKKKILAIGSSMTLNNLNSQSIAKQDTSYINAASWGASMKDNFLLLKVLAGIYDPETLIISSYDIDFTQEDKVVKWDLLTDYLTSSKDHIAYYHLRCFNLSYYEENINYVKKIRTFKHDEQYMGFDSYGAISVDSRRFIINPKRWNDDLLYRKPLVQQYAYLDSIATFCRDRQIDLLFFQSPLRKGLDQKLSKEKRNKHLAHITKLEALSRKHHFAFINSEDLVWDDSLFTDAIHLNASGAALYTRYCLNTVRSQ